MTTAGRKVLSRMLGAKRSGATFDWLLLGHFGGANVGDEAMLGGALAYLHELRLKAQVAVSDVDASQRIHGDRATWRLDSTTEVLRSLRSSRGVAWVGGTHLHDELRGARLVYHWGSLSRYALYLWVARLLGIKTVVVGHGVGRMTSRITRAIARIALAGCEQVSVRDIPSEKNVHRVCTPAKVSVGFDLAALLAGRKDTEIGQPEWSVAIAPRLTATYDHDFWLTLVLDCAEQFGGSRILLLPFENSWPADDDEFVKDLAQEVCTLTGEQIAWHRLDGDPARAMSFLERSGLVIAGRYHAAVLSVLLQRNLVIVPYETKLLAIAESVGLPASLIAAPATRLTALFPSLEANRVAYDVQLMQKSAQKAAAPLASRPR